MGSRQRSTESGSWCCIFVPPPVFSFLFAGGDTHACISTYIEFPWCALRRGYKTRTGGAGPGRDAQPALSVGTNGGLGLCAGTWSNVNGWGVVGERRAGEGKRPCILFSTRLKCFFVFGVGVGVHARGVAQASVVSLMRLVPSLGSFFPRCFFSYCIRVRVLPACVAILEKAHPIRPGRPAGGLHVVLQGIRQVICCSCTCIRYGGSFQLPVMGRRTPLYPVACGSD